ncbi:MAG: hypothetical protein U1G08_12940 [Verrucomicrobiota bacterium]
MKSTRTARMAVWTLTATALASRLLAEDPAPLDPDHPPRMNPADYVGAERCATCHADHAAGWQTTRHRRMVRRPVTEGPDRTVLGDFSIASTNHPDLKEVRWVIGSRWKQRYLVEVNGEEVVFNGQWNIQEQKWQPYTARQDWWWSSHSDWRKRSNFRLCAGCHSTGSDPET